MYGVLLRGVVYCPHMHIHLIWVRSSSGHSLEVNFTILDEWAKYPLA